MDGWMGWMGWDGWMGFFISSESSQGIRHSVGYGEIQSLFLIRRINNKLEHTNINLSIYQSINQSINQ